MGTALHELPRGQVGLPFEKSIGTTFSVSATTYRVRRGLEVVPDARALVLLVPKYQNLTRISNLSSYQRRCSKQGGGNAGTQCRNNPTA